MERKAPLISHRWSAWKMPSCEEKPDFLRTPNPRKMGKVFGQHLQRCRACGNEGAYPSGSACVGRVLPLQQEKSRGCPLLVGRNRHCAASRARARCTPATLNVGGQHPGRIAPRCALSRRWRTNPPSFLEMQDSGRHAPQTGAGPRRAKHHDDGRARRVHPVEIGGGS